MKAFLTGLTAGAAIGVLLAPDEGRRTRQRLRAQGTEIAELTRQQASELKNIFRHPERAIQKIKEISPPVGEAAEKAAGAARSVASKLGVGPAAVLNTADRERLMEVEGIGPVLADRIIDGRPYSSPRELVERGILAESTFKSLERQLLKAG
jgi:DNA uptake protein ComE-like DNA-binding protein